MVFLGSDYVFGQASETLDKLLGIKVSAKQVERVSERIGQIIEDEQVLKKTKSQEKTCTDIVSTHYHYVEMDGSMIFTREEKWKEIKLGRVFSVPIKEALEGPQLDIGESEYVAHLGSSDEFLPRLQVLVPKVEHPIFIADGAPWIWKWVKENYPNAVQVLDYFHAMGYAHDFAKVAFLDKKDYDNWIGGVENYLLTDRVEALTRHMDWLAERVVPESLSMLKRLKEYYLKNLHRMYYGTLRKNGVFIGSGAIESAHRNVIQKRMKLSGQRWSIKGARAMLQLRVTKNRAKWDTVVDVIRGRQSPLKIAA
ncbi:hypothetical protein OQ292_34995 (plasmid) [Chondrinema litorale]|nr:hypothetical protein [Chondrinema litorale]UZR99080.1 hypothetical protein OQ292_34995 [Chondrinema litorale]